MGGWINEGNRENAKERKREMELCRSEEGPGFGADSYPFLGQPGQYHLSAAH